ncbi:MULTISPECIES: hypothetical protein [Gardnerella]|uniref:hypothetical protein n=1 Tax=Gardnerella TaxID=2701 RepID=UPI00061D8E70|nr:hypothetical protein [Gardnerella vaginalis]MDK7189401.1 hypothetical protein [Bifidobacterium sp. UMB1230]
MISHGNGLLVIPENKVTEFKKLLVAYYEGEDLQSVTDALACACEDDWEARCKNERKRIGGRLR